MDKYENDVHNCTPEQLAHMLAEHNKWRRGEKPYDTVGDNPPYSPRLIGQVVDEVVRRLRELNKPTY